MFDIHEHEWTAWQPAPEPSRDDVARESRHCTQWGCDAVQIRPSATDLVGEVEHLLLDNVRHWGNQLLGSGSGNLNCSLKDAAAAIAHWLELDDDIVLAAVAHQRDVLSDENLRLRGQAGEMAEEIQRLEADLAVTVHEATTARAKVASDEAQL